MQSTHFNITIDNLALLRNKNIKGVAQLAVFLSLDSAKSFGDAAKEAGVSLRCVELLISRKNKNFKKVKFKPGPDFSPKGRHPKRAIERTAQGQRLYEQLIS